MTDEQQVETTADATDELVSETERIRRALRSTVDQLERYVVDLQAEVTRRREARGDQQ